MKFYKVDFLTSADDVLREGYYVVTSLGERYYANSLENAQALLKQFVLNHEGLFCLVSSNKIITAVGSYELMVQIICRIPGTSLRADESGTYSVDIWDNGQEFERVHQLFENDERWHEAQDYLKRNAK